MRFLAFVILFMLALATACAADAQSAPKAGDVVYATGFEGSDPLEGWSGAAQFEAGYGSSRALVIERPVGMENGGASVTRTLPVERLRGCTLLFSAKVKAEGVSKRPMPWNGVKFMVPIKTKGGTLWPQCSLPEGSFGWQSVVFKVAVPEDATEATLLLGLEMVSGKVWFDDIRVTVLRQMVKTPARSSKGPVYTGHAVPRLRGTMIDPNHMTEDDVRTLGKEWKANLVRWQLVGWAPSGPKLDLAAYDAWLTGELRKLDAALPLLRKYGLMVALDLHCGPGGSDESGRGLFNDRSCQQKFIEVWRRMARKYKDEPAIWGYDLLNEPVENRISADVYDWQGLMERAARAVRAIDRRKTLIIEPAEGGDPAALKSLIPLSDPRVVYSVHVYQPHTFTHQGVFGEWVKCEYPGDINGVTWNKERLQEVLRPVVEFQKKYHVQIYIGEFSAIRWAPNGSACRYLSDAIDLFESHGWDWSYHAYREWDGWSVEHTSDKDDHNRSTQPTDRQKLLTKWFAKNTKPVWTGGR